MIVLEHWAVILWVAVAGCSKKCWGRCGALHAGGKFSLVWFAPFALIHKLIFIVPWGAMLWVRRPAFHPFQVGTDVEIDVLLVLVFWIYRLWAICSEDYLITYLWCLLKHKLLIIHFWSQVASELSKVQGVAKVLVAQHDAYKGFLAGESCSCSYLLIKEIYLGSCDWK